MRETDLTPSSRLFWFWLRLFVRSACYTHSVCYGRKPARSSKWMITTTTIGTVVWICLALTSYTTKFWIPAWRNGREGNKNGNVTAIEFGFPPSLQATKLCRCCVNIVVVVFLRLSTVNGFQLPPSCMLEYPRVPLFPRLHSYKSPIELLHWIVTARFRVCIPLSTWTLANLPVCGWAICFVFLQIRQVWHSSVAWSCHHISISICSTMNPTAIQMEAVRDLFDSLY